MSNDCPHVPITIIEQSTVLHSKYILITYGQGRDNVNMSVVVVVMLVLFGCRSSHALL